MAMSNGNVRRLRVLYICGERPEAAMLQRLEALVGAGVDGVQLRRKEAAGRELYEDAVRLAAFCRDRDALFFVNDRLDVALASGADGVHLGARDLPVAAARRLAPPDFLIGATARSPESALAAERDGADYVGSGAAFASRTKSDTVRIGPEGIEAVAAAVGIPVLAIGGIGAENLAQLANRGISGVAMGDALCGGDGPGIAGEASRMMRNAE